MKRQPITNEHPIRRPGAPVSPRVREAGAQAARSRPVVSADHHRHAIHKRSAAELHTHLVESAKDSRESLRWIVENQRLVRTAVKETGELERSIRGCPLVAARGEKAVPRAIAIASAYLEAVDASFREDTLQQFMSGYQSVAEIAMDEIWALRPALEAALLDRLEHAPAAEWPVLLTSLRRIAEVPWRELFETMSAVERTLERDPSGAYSRMDDDSRDMYRRAVAGLAKHSELSEHEIAAKAVELAAHEHGRRGHVGFFLIDSGRDELRAAVGYKPTLMDRVLGAMLRNPTAFYLILIELLTFLVVIGLLQGLNVLTPIVAGFVLLLLPATQAAVDFVNNLVSTLVPPRVLPKLDFSHGIPADCATMVAVPTLLINEAQVRDLVLDLEIRYLANRDPHLYFALLTDSPDSDAPSDERDALVTTCRELIERLNHRYGSGGRSPFYMFHRHRAFNPSEGRWMGWERKRGKLLDLNRLLRAGFDSFPVKAGDLSVLPRVRYVITLDSDTQLPRESAAKLVGAMAHPLNRAVVDPVTKMVVEGYGILQPRIGISIQSASRSRLASIYSGQTGFDIYTRAVSDVYQDLFGEGIFTGKGIYEVDALRETLEQRFPENALLSHDLIEGAYARVALASDIELIDDYPSHFSAYSRRKHRWVRGDWQVMRWLLNRVPDYHGRMIPNPISLISRWKILDNLRRSVLEPSMFLLLLFGWLCLPGRVWYWTAAAVAVLFLPVYTNLLFSLWRAPWRGGRQFGVWARETADAFVKGNVRSALSLVFLLHQAMLSVDAIARSVLRVFVTKRKLLEWETAAEAEVATRQRSTVDVYLAWTPAISLAIGLAVWLLRPAALPYALPVLALWLASRAISAWLNGAPRLVHRELRDEDTELLHEWAARMHRFFTEWSTEATHWLIPDSVRESGEFAMRISPTNLGLLLNARVAAVHLGMLPVARFAHETRLTLDTVAHMEKCRGHLLNWYDARTLAPLEPRFVSTVDSGNLAACLWTLKQAAFSFADDAKGTLASELREIGATCERLVREMDFRFLYQERKKVLSVGYDATAGRLDPSSYDLLASEARIATFVAIAKGDIPQAAWFHMGRAHTLVGGERVLLSWTGTMFEYLMPALWMRHHAGTIGEQSNRAVVRVQRAYGRKKGVPWGISESACLGAADGEPGYAPFGVPELAIKPTEPGTLVIAPYATFLALAVDPVAAMRNLRSMEEFGWLGRYGFYEAVDYRTAGAEVIRSWMAHHQGMSLLAVANLLCDNAMARHFHAEPQVLATELLLHERVPNAAAVQTDVPDVGLEEALQAGMS